MKTLRFRIESAIPRELVVGDGNVLVIRGWALPPADAAITGFAVSLDERRYELPHTHDVRIDLIRDSSIVAPNEHKLVSGFWLPIATPRELADKTCRLNVSLQLDSGDSHPLVDQEIALRAQLPNQLNGQLSKLPPASLAVCMTTADPDLRRFERRLSSLRAQSHRDWICLVQDDGSHPSAFARLAELCRQDPRVVLVRSQERLGRYRAVERCLGHVPPTIEHVALYDADEEAWAPDRLARAVARLRGGVELVYSDSSASGDGGLAVMRNATLRRALPFPEALSELGHHDWIASVAMVRGSVERLDAADSDEGRGSATWEPKALSRSVVAAAGHAASVMRPTELRNGLFTIVDRYYGDYRPLALRRQILELRFPEIDPDKRRPAQGFALAATAVAHDVVHPVLPRVLSAYNRAKAARRALGAAAAWAKRASNGDTALHRALPYWKQHDAATFVKKAVHVVAKQAGQILIATPDPTPPVDDVITAGALVRRRFPGLAALPTYSSPRQGRRINLVTDSINAGSLYGGVGTALIFASLLAERRRCDLRIITRTERGDTHNFARLMELAKIPMLRNVEFRFCDVESPTVDVDVDDHELFVTTSWWTTYSTRKSIASSRIIYVLQEDERMFYPHGDDHLRCSELLADRGLRLLINSELLVSHLAEAGLPDVAQRCLWFEPSFPRELFYAEPAAERRKQRFFFYARPFNQRNMFYRGLEAIDEAITRGTLDPDGWEIHFAGREIPRIKFPRDVEPFVHQNLDWSGYAALIRSVDLGLSLMYTPHPSYPPLDLAASGAVVVTNRFANKQNLDRYSRNILCVEPTVDALVAGIEAGVALSRDRAARTANYEESRLQRDWHASFAQALDALADLP